MKVIVSSVQAISGSVWLKLGAVPAVIIILCGVYAVANIYLCLQDDEGWKYLHWYTVPGASVAIIVLAGAMYLFLALLNLTFMT